jgi:hypothetical protein
LADGLVSLIDDSLILFFNIRTLTLIRTLVSLPALLLLVVTYILMAFTSAVPKRFFLPITLYMPVAGLLGILGLIYFYSRAQQIAWLISLCQVLVGLVILRQVQGGFQFRWPLVPEKHLEGGRFSWLNLSGFVLVNLLVLLPATVFYLFFCAGVAINRFSEGFVALRSNGLTVQVRKYVRNDGKTVQLFPMAHIGDPDFYRNLTASFPTNSIILMEGVSDERNLLTNRISYRRMASTLGLAEQQREFKPRPSQAVRADVDVEQFSTNTIDFLNLVMLIHSKGINTENLMRIMQYSPPPHFEERLWDDLLHKRNQHLVEEIQSHLPKSDDLIVPWGAAHMPGIAKEIEKAGFHLKETHDYTVIRFGSRRRTNTNAPSQQSDVHKP